MMLMSELRWGVKPPFKGLKPTPTVKSEPIRDADEILFENLGHLHETGAITILENTKEKAAHYKKAGIPID